MNSEVKLKLFAWFWVFISESAYLQEASFCLSHVHRGLSSPTPHRCGRTPRASGAALERCELCAVKDVTALPHRCILNTQCTLMQSLIRSVKQCATMFCSALLFFVVHVFFYSVCLLKRLYKRIRRRHISMCDPVFCNVCILLHFRFPNSTAGVRVQS